MTGNGLKYISLSAQLINLLFIQDKICFLQRIILKTISTRNKDHNVFHNCDVRMYALLDSYYMCFSLLSFLNWLIFFLFLSLIQVSQTLEKGIQKQMLCLGCYKTTCPSWRGDLGTLGRWPFHWGQRPTWAKANRRNPSLFEDPIRIFQSEHQRGAMVSV